MQRSGCLGSHTQLLTPKHSPLAFPQSTAALPQSFHYEWGTIDLIFHIGATADVAAENHAPNRDCAREPLYSSCYGSLVDALAL